MIEKKLYCIDLIHTTHMAEVYLRPPCGWTPSSPCGWRLQLKKVKLAKTLPSKQTRGLLSNI